MQRHQEIAGFADATNQIVFHRDDSWLACAGGYRDVIETQFPCVFDCQRPTKPYATVQLAHAYKLRLPLICIKTRPRVSPITASAFCLSLGSDRQRRFVLAEPIRQARIRAEYAAWYPTIQVATWLPARSVARAVERQLLGEPSQWSLGPRWVPGPRLLDDRHFFFRGGSERDPVTRSRREDSTPGTGRPAPSGEQPWVEGNQPGP